MGSTKPIFLKRAKHFGEQTTELTELRGRWYWLDGNCVIRTQIPVGERDTVKYFKLQSQAQKGDENEVTENMSDSRA